MLSPAKLNLSLRVLSKRPDGFHEIDTLMVKLHGLSDEITLTPSENFSFTCSDPSLPTDSSNLVVKTAQAFSEKTGLPVNYHIHLTKNIPHGAGLGGGSSNDATTLLALNDLHNSPLSHQDLLTIATKLGSDIPFFLHDGTARCTGRGEIISPQPPPPPLPVVLLKPAFSVSTPDAYRNCLDASPLHGIRYEPKNYSDISFVNDLEKNVFTKHRYLAELKSWLLERRNTKIALMSGSGSTMFAILREGTDPESLIHTARKYFDSNLWAWSGNL
jgi:4-diphosphocytidyl-2-C-methyl-D-erythritol kinase